MYDVALSVLSCIRAGTRVHVAWVVENGRNASGEAVAITPGGGRIGSLAEGALDGAIIDRLSSIADAGSVVSIDIGPLEAMTSRFEQGERVDIAISPGETIPRPIWEALAERRPVAFRFEVSNGGLGAVSIVDGAEAQEAAETILCTYSPTPRAVIAGGGPIAECLAQAFALIGWSPVEVHGPGEVSGIAPTLSPIDGVVIMGHDVEASGRSLQAAINSRAGYIASLGSRKMQEQRKDWLAYRGIAWDQRIHGPAGLPIGAKEPGEIAVSIVAEAIASTRIAEPPGS